MGNNDFQLSDFFLQATWQNEEYVAEQIAKIRRHLDSKGVDINTPAYKSETSYRKIRDERIDGFPGGAMSLEEFVDRFLFTEYTFESIYDMGNSCEIKNSECTDNAVAAEICRILSLGKNGVTIADVCNELERKSGLIDRIKKYFGIDLNELDRNDNREKRERSKILYFFYMLEHRLYPNINVLMLLDKPSMENIDNTFWGRQTHNGKILRTAKEALGKELSLDEKDRIHSAIADISIEWDNILNNARLLLDFLHDYGFDYNSVELIQSPIPIYASDNGNTHQYPVERLYLIISQREYWGNLLDIVFVNKIQNSNDYDVCPELVEEMKALIHTSVDLNNAEKYIKDNALIAIQEIIKEYQRQKTNQRSRKGGSARKPQQYHAEAEVII